MNENKKYFYGNEISEYGMQHNRVDYATLAKAFDAVLCNSITDLFYSTINGEYVEPEQVNGFIDNSEEIEELEEQIEELEEQIEELEEQLNKMDSLFDPDEEQYNKIQKQIDDLQEQIDDLEREQDEQPEIFQYFIISDSGYNTLKYHTNEIVYYIPVLDIYVWGVTHCGTSWNYVLTDIKIEEDSEQ
jgi:DNA repair exonuclease SbcCD ATPase subunit